MKDRKSELQVSLVTKTVIQFNFFNLAIYMDKKKVVKFILECVKYIVSAAIGYFGGNAVM